MQNSNLGNNAEKTKEKTPGIFSSLLEMVKGSGGNDSKVEKQDLKEEAEKVKKESKRDRVDVSLDQLGDEVDNLAPEKKIKGKKEVEKVSAETRKMVEQFGFLKKSFLFLRGSKFREELDKLDKVSRAKLIFSEINNLAHKNFSEVWSDSEGFLNKMKNLILWAGIKTFKQTKEGKEIFGTVDKYGPLASQIKGKVDDAVETGKETIQTAERIKDDNASAAAMAKAAPGQIGKFLKTPNKSEKIIEFLKKSAKNPSFQKMVASGKVRGLTLSKKVGAGGIIILAADKIKELITTGEISMGNDQKNFFETWIFDYDAFIQKGTNLKNSISENGVLNSKLAATEFSLEIGDVVLTGATIMALLPLLIASAPLSMATGFLSAVWFALRRGSLHGLKKMIPKLGLFFTEKFGKKGATEALKKAAKSQGVKKVGKSVAIQTGLSMAMSKGIDFVNNHLLSTAKVVGKKIASVALSKNQKFILRKVAGVDI